MPKSKAKNNISDPKKSEELSSTRRQTTSPTDDRVSVFVRISEKATRILKEASKAPRTKGMVIEALLENFNREQNPERKEQILKGQLHDPFKEQGALLELRSWAEHAFQNKRYVWAGGMYEMLANHPSSSQGLKNICNYRLSICLIRLSYEIREEALGEPESKNPIEKDIYGLALDVLDRAIRYTITLQSRLGAELGFPKLVLYYNLASCHSLKAQYLVERELDLKTNSGFIGALRQAGRQPELKEKAWVSIGETWRGLINEDGPADLEAEQAFNELINILPSSSHDGVVHDQSQFMKLDLLSEKLALVDSTLTDEDFIFLRLDTQKWQAKYKAWASLVAGRKPTTDAVRSLLERLP